MEEIIGDIENEVYAFLFKGKKAQLGLFGADGEAAPGLDNAPGDPGLFLEVGDPANEGDDNEPTGDDDTDKMSAPPSDFISLITSYPFQVHLLA